MDALTRLVAADPTADRGEIPLEVFPLRLGRRPDADICVVDRWVSRDHCEIDYVDDALLVRDLNSKHGTFVNGCAICEATLKAGDLLCVGLSKFIVQCAYEATNCNARKNALVS